VLTKDVGSTPVRRWTEQELPALLHDGAAACGTAVIG
jgi:hypothetical protein